MDLRQAFLNAGLGSERSFSIGAAYLDLYPILDL
jgi:hypothetical protein